MYEYADLVSIFVVWVRQQFQCFMTLDYVK